MRRVLVMVKNIMLTALHANGAHAVRYSKMEHVSLVLRFSCNLSSIEVALQAGAGNLVVLGLACDKEGNYVHLQPACLLVCPLVSWQAETASPSWQSLS